MEVEMAGFTGPFWKLIDADKGKPISAQALADLEIITSAELNNSDPER